MIVYNLFKLTLWSKTEYTAAENELKCNYLACVTSLSLTELKASNKYKYKEIMIKEIKTRLPTYNDKIISDSCNWISYALNNGNQR